MKTTRAQVKSIIEANIHLDGVSQTSLKHCSLARFSSPGVTIPALYVPSVCLIVNGSKTAATEERSISYNEEHCLVASMNVPTMALIERASAEAPYLGIQIELDIPLLRKLAESLDIYRSTPIQEDPFCLAVAALEAPFLASVAHYLSLLETPSDIADLQEVRLLEVYSRLLRGPHAPSILTLLQSDSHSEKISRAVSYISNNLSQPITIEKLATVATMSTSSFHQHFKNLIDFSPLQYIKRTRLIEARKLMLLDGLNAAKASFHVGYESPSQFSRDYRRLFGQPPKKDVAQLHERFIQ